MAGPSSLPARDPRAPSSDVPDDRPIRIACWTAQARVARGHAGQGGPTSPNTRCRNSAICARVTGSFGQNSEVAVRHPVV